MRGFVGAAASAVTTLVVFLLASPLAFALSMSPSKMTTATVQNSIGGPALRKAVLEASAADVSSAATSSLDINGIMWMEHINLVVSSRPIAEKFYMDFLGFTKDKSPSFHVNLGQQQLHLAENGDPWRMRHLGRFKRSRDVERQMAHAPSDAPHRETA